MTNLQKVSETQEHVKQLGGGGGMNWAIGIDMYTLMCVKLMTNKNLLYKIYMLKQISI